MRKIDERDIEQEPLTQRYPAKVTDYRLLTSRPTAEAHVVAGALQAEGLRVRLERDGLGAIYGLTRGVFATRLLVHVDDHEAAVALLREIES